MPLATAGSSFPWRARPSRTPALRAATRRSSYPLFTQERGETVWKFGMGPERGLRERPGWVEGVPISRLLLPKKCSRDAFSYFPNSFGKRFLRTSPLRLSKNFAKKRCSARRNIHRGFFAVCSHSGRGRDVLPNEG